MKALELTEIQYMQEDEAYLKDFALSSPEFIQLDKIHEEAQDTAQKLAASNVEKKKQIDELSGANTELQTEFTTKQAELKELLEQYKQKKEEVNCDISNMIKMMTQKTNELNKECNAIQKKLKKGEITYDEYVKTYKEAKQKHSQAHYTQLALQAK